MKWKLTEHEILTPGHGFDAVFGREEWKTMLTGCAAGLRLQKETGLLKTFVFLLTGAQGTGKTALARGFAKETGYRFFLFSPEDFLGVTAEEAWENIAVFSQELAAVAPFFLLLEDMDGEEAKKAAKPLAQMFIKLKNKGVPLICVMTAKEEQQVASDLRSLSFVCRLKNPRKDERAAFFEGTLGTTVKCSSGYGWEQMAQETEGFSFADCRNVSQFAAALLIGKGLSSCGNPAAAFEAVNGGALLLTPEIFEQARLMAQPQLQPYLMQSCPIIPAAEGSKAREESAAGEKPAMGKEPETEEKAASAKRETKYQEVDYDIPLGDIFGADSEMNPNNL